MCRMEKVPGHGLCPDLSGPGRPARSTHIPDRRQIGARSAAELWFLAISYLEIAHWSILLTGIEGHGEDLDENGCFTSRTCVLRLDRYGSSGYFFFEKHSLIDFQIGKGRKREFRAAELRFSLHKEFCAAEIRFYLHKEYVGAILKKIAILLKENWSHMDILRRRCWWKSSFYWKKIGRTWTKFQYINIFQTFPRCEQLGGDASRNDDFQREKQRLQGPNVFKELSFYIQ